MRQMAQVTLTLTDAEADDLLIALGQRDGARVRVGIDRSGFKYAIGGGVWSPGYGSGDVGELSLTERFAIRDRLREQGRRVTKWDLIPEPERRSLAATRFGRPCDGCGLRLETEADFARHFWLPDVQYLNLGRCPEKD